MSKRAIAAQAIERCGLGRFLRRAKSWRGLLVLNYHRLASTAGEVLDQGVWSAVPEQLDAQVRFLKRQGELLDPADLTADLVSPAARSRHMMLTFDDGYRDNHAIALPILQAHRARAVFFVITGVLDSPRPMWWDEVAWMLRACTATDLTYAGQSWSLVDGERWEIAVDGLLRTYKELPTDETDAFLDGLGQASGTGRMPPELGRELWLTWDQVRQMAAAGMTIGGHTVSHPLLARSSRERIEAELRGCESRLREEVGRPMEWFSYPVGGETAFNAEAAGLLRQLGVRWACSQYGGFQRPGELQPLNIKRVPIERWLIGPQFAALVALPSVFA